MDAIQLFKDVKEDDCPASNYICLDKHENACNCSNFLDVDWLSSSGNSFEEEIYERYLLECTYFLLWNVSGESETLKWSQFNDVFDFAKNNRC